MSNFQTTTARQWAQLAWLGLALAVTIVGIVALVLPMAALALATALVVAGVTLTAQRLRAAARSVRSAATGGARSASPALLVELDDGALLQARPVAQPGASEHVMVLTRAGYMLLDSEGEVLYRL